MLPQDTSTRANPVTEATPPSIMRVQHAMAAAEQGGTMPQATGRHAHNACKTLQYSSNKLAFVLYKCQCTEQDKEQHTTVSTPTEAPCSCSGSGCHL